MKVYISADMEGVTGVTHPQDVIPGRPRYERFRHLLTADVNAAIEGAAEAGATEFVVNEAHDGMRNVVLEDLDERAELIIGDMKSLVMMEGFEGADAVFFVGYHARAGTSDVLSHTFDNPAVVTDVELNGEPCSEARMNATLAGLQGIPVGLVTGDDLTCEEAGILVPWRPDRAGQDRRGPLLRPMPAPEVGPRTHPGGRARRVQSRSVRAL